jgi:hypothetical protein
MLAGSGRGPATPARTATAATPPARDGSMTKRGPGALLPMVTVGSRVSWLQQRTSVGFGARFGAEGLTCAVFALSFTLVLIAFARGRLVGAIRSPTYRITSRECHGRVAFSRVVYEVVAALGVNMGAVRPGRCLDLTYRLDSPWPCPLTGSTRRCGFHLPDRIAAIARPPGSTRGNAAPGKPACREGKPEEDGESSREVDRRTASRAGESTLPPAGRWDLRIARPSLCSSLRHGERGGGCGAAIVMAWRSGPT